MSVGRRQGLIEPAHPRLSIVRQCELVALSRSSFYYRPVGESAENLALMRRIDEQFLATPWYGARQMVRHLRRQGHAVGRKRVRRLMAKMGLAAVYQRPRTTVPHPGHRIWPYLLREPAVDRPDQVGCADITSIPLRRGSLDLVAVMDRAGRKVPARRPSNTPDAGFRIDRRGPRGGAGAVRARAGGDLRHRPGQPVHRPALHRRLDRGRRPGVDGRGRGRGRRMDDVVIERPWRSMRYGRVDRHAFGTGSGAAGRARPVARVRQTPTGGTRPASAAGPRPRPVRAPRPASARRRDPNPNQAHPSRQAVRRSRTSSGTSFTGLEARDRWPV